MMERAKRGQLLTVALVILAAAALLTLPAVLGPVRFNDSFWIDWVWLDQFARELGRGIFYPRWLPLSHGGLGSPVFYYYPPLAFYAGSTFVLAGMPTYAALLATFMLGYALSGAAMYYWLKPWAQNPQLGSLVFMVAPYHTFNFYGRGAIAEFMATIFIPLILAGLWRLKHQESGGFLVTALAYAGLIATHLPLAVLVSVFLLAPLLLIDASRSHQTLAPAVLALVIGVALAAICWLPALLLGPYRDSAKLWFDPRLQPSNWTFWNAGFRASANYLAILVIGGAIAIPLAILVARHRSQWAAYGLLCVLLAIGVIPAIWGLPLLRSVQFPFRLLPLAEFALATAIAGVSWKPSAVGVAIAPLLAISALIMEVPPPDQGVTGTDVHVLYADVPENLPRGDRPYSWPSRWALAVAAQHHQPQLVNGTTIDTVFYFPAWQVRCAGRPAPAFPDRQTQLLSYHGQSCTRSLELTAAEKIGAAFSLFGLLVLAGVCLTRRSHR